jgi:hypothetical protein
MATIVQNKDIPGEIRVAAVFNSGKIKPIWFELANHPAAGRIFVTEVNMVWSHHKGSARILSFAVSARDGNNYTLEFNTEDFVWSLSVVESIPMA